MRFDITLRHTKTITPTPQLESRLVLIETHLLTLIHQGAKMATAAERIISVAASIQAKVDETATTVAEVIRILKDRPEDPALVEAANMLEGAHAKLTDVEDKADDELPAA